MQLHFTDDAQEPSFELKHKLKLYSGEDQQANQNPKKPVWPLDRVMLLVMKAHCHCFCCGEQTNAMPYPR